ncbi:SDR family oxidoreductase [Salinisphaera sp.]|uniref:SDR family oxidoreductase n=1 Tax=Salinisphaera sp. TaxID=1914330 RepID=UPI002D7725CC|nr:SDR family oxidoreductase [Salinisphaera sp.]HET7312804.1 SDR family oxidoreductase [Salinisphaera sp.]
MRLKAIEDQVMVITGASSGMGLVTARAAARRGARLVLVSRDEKTLNKLAEELSMKGGRAIAVPADMTVEADAQRVADQAIEHFGGFDTWANIAGLTIYGSIEEVEREDHRRLFEINYWSTFNGSLVAAKHLRERGGALINMGSILSDMSVAYQGTYCASKHAVKAFTNALRMELEAAHAPISVTLIKPSSIDTPLRHHGKNFFSKEPQNPPPAYAPELVAETIIQCAQFPRREIVIGGGGRLLTLLTNLAPRLAELFLEKTAVRLQTTKNPAGPRDKNSLYAPSENGRERGGSKWVFEHSPYTQAQLKPATAAAIGIGIGVGVLTTALLAPKRSSRNRALRRLRR